MTNKVQKAIEEISEQFDNEPESDNLVDKSDQFLINSKDTDYLSSINYSFGNKILKYDPIKFRKEMQIISVEFEKIQLEFCNGTVETCFDNNSAAVNMPLLQLSLDKIDFSKAEHKMDNTFCPTDKIIENLDTKRYKVFIKDLPPVLELNASLKLESNYFNQIT